MLNDVDDEFMRVPGLYRLWDLQFVIAGEDEWQVHYVEPTADGMPLFAVYRRRPDRSSEPAP